MLWVESPLQGWTLKVAGFCSSKENSEQTLPGRQGRVGQEYLWAVQPPGQLRAASWTDRELAGRTPGPISLQSQKRHSQFTATTQFLKSSSSSFREVNHLLPGSSLSWSPTSNSGTSGLRFAQSSRQSWRLSLHFPSTFLEWNHLKTPGCLTRR